MLGKAVSWVGQVLGGRYEVTAKLEEGGMAVLYRARDRNLGCDVAIKVPQAVLLQDQTFAGRFSREVRSLMQRTGPYRTRREKGKVRPFVRFNESCFLCVPISLHNMIRVAG